MPDQRTALEEFLAATEALAAANTRVALAAGRLAAERASQPALAPINAMPDLPAVLNVNQAARVLGVGRNAVYELCARGRLGSVKVGQRVRIPRNAIVAFLESKGTA